MKPVSLSGIHLVESWVATVTPAIDSILVLSLACALKLKTKIINIKNFIAISLPDYIAITTPSQ
jgi:hypothetical protein